MEKKKYYYTIGETADILGETVSRIRFWTDSFADAVKPHRNKKGNRIYTEADIETLKAIKYLTKDCGMTIKGAQERLRTQKTMGQAQRPRLSKLRRPTALRTSKPRPRC